MDSRERLGSGRGVGVSPRGTRRRCQRHQQAGRFGHSHADESAANATATGKSVSGRSTAYAEFRNSPLSDRTRAAPAICRRLPRRHRHEQPCEPERLVCVPTPRHLPTIPEIEQVDHTGMVREAVSGASPTPGKEHHTLYTHFLVFLVLLVFFTSGIPTAYPDEKTAAGKPGDRFAND